MKKFSLLKATLICMAVVLFAACQKDHDKTTEPPVIASSLNEGAVNGVAGTGPFAGSIKNNYAAALAANYAKKFDGQTQYVAFPAKDLIAFLTNLQTKYKSDIIYVNLGVYGKDAAPVNNKDWGKLTVFFSGNHTGNSGARRTDDDPTDPDLYLNHGGVGP